MDRTERSNFFGGKLSCFISIQLCIIIEYSEKYPKKWSCNFPCNFPHVWMAYVSRHKIWILRVLFEDYERDSVLCYRICSLWEYSYKPLFNLERPAALAKGLNSLLIPFAWADHSNGWLRYFNHTLRMVFDDSCILHIITKRFIYQNISSAI